MTLIDCDRHVIEPIAMWRRYLPEPFKDGAPVLAHPEADEPLRARLARLGPHGLDPLPPVPMLDGERLQRGFSERAQREISRQTFARAAQLEAATRPDGQLAAMDAAGVDLAFLFPTYAQYLLAVDGMEPARASAFARAYNDWLRDYCAADPTRLARRRRDRAPRRGRDGARARARDRPRLVGGGAAAQPDRRPAPGRSGARAVLDRVRGGRRRGRVPRGPPRPGADAGADRFATRFAQHACSHPMEMMMALLDLIEGGVLERHPRLRVGFLEAGCGWLPSWLWRLDEEYDQLAGEVAEHVRMPPSAYFRRQGFIALEPGEPDLARTIDAIGADCVLFGSDAPHLDHEADLVARLTGPDGPLPPDLLRRVTDTNPRGSSACRSPPNLASRRKAPSPRDPGSASWEGAPHRGSDEASVAHEGPCPPSLHLGLATNPQQHVNGYARPLEL